MFSRYTAITIILSIASYHDFVYAHPQPGDLHLLQNRGVRLNPAKPAALASTCHATDNRVPINGQQGRFRPDTANRNYPEFAYTKGQVQAALRSGAERAATTISQTPNPRDYPHRFGNWEGLQTRCTGKKNLLEYPILMEPSTYFDNAMNTDNIPDRVLFTAVEDKIGGKDVLTIQYCGVMRHGPGNAFFMCT